MKTKGPATSTTTLRALSSARRKHGQFFFLFSTRYSRFQESIRQVAPLPSCHFCCAVAPPYGRALQHGGSHMISRFSLCTSTYLVLFRLISPPTAGTSKANQCAAPSLHLSGVGEDGPVPWQHPGAPGCQRERAPEGRGIKEAIVLQC